MNNTAPLNTRISKALTGHKKNAYTIAELTFEAVDHGAKHGNVTPMTTLLQGVPQRKGAA